MNIFRDFSHKLFTLLIYFLFKNELIQTPASLKKIKALLLNFSAFWGEMTHEGSRHERSPFSVRAAARGSASAPQCGLEKPINQLQIDHAGSQ